MSKWTWYGLMYKLAQGDITRIPDIGKLNFKYALNHLVYERTRENYIEAKKKEMKRNKSL